MKWISVEDRLPREGKLVCILVDRGAGLYEQGAYIWRNPKGWFRDWLSTPYTKLSITHWTLIPEPPESE